MRTARKMLFRNIDIETVKDVTGLTDEELEKIKNNYINLKNGRADGI